MTESHKDERGEDAGNQPDVSRPEARLRQATATADRDTEARLHEAVERIRRQLNPEHADGKLARPAEEPLTACDSSRSEGELMSNAPSVDEIMQRIRAEVQARQGKTAPSKPPTVKIAEPQSASQPARDLSPLRSEVTAALLGHQQVGQLNPRPPGIVNNVLQFLKKVMKRSLTWYTRPIHLFQNAVIRALQLITATLQSQEEELRTVTQDVANKAEAQSDAVRQVSSHLQALQRRQSEMENNFSGWDSKLQEALLPYTQRLAAITDELVFLRSQMRDVDEKQREAAQHRRGADRDLRRLVYAVENGKLPVSAAAALPTPAMFPAEVKDESAFDYFLFEERYRGDEADIRARQKTYLEYFRGRQNVVDIGCGRGEFLELLRDHNISAQGVELGTDQYLLCREKGLNVVQQDLFAFLESIPDESLGGLFSAQVIEHMTASDQLRYVALAYRKTNAGSPVIFETINPECAFALLHNFFLDPTHVRPVHPDTLKFAMESVGFSNVEVRFSSPVTDRRVPALQNGNPENLQQFNRAIQQLNDLLYGYQDYAAIGRKGTGASSAL